MNTQPQENASHHFLIGLMTVSAIGAGLAIVFAPRLASGLRQRATDSARNLWTRGSERYQQANARIGDAVDELTRKGQDVRDDVAEAVVQSARVVERYAAGAQSTPLEHVTRRQSANRT